MNALKWLAAMATMACVSIVGCAGGDDSVDDEVELDDDEAEVSEPAQNQAPAPGTDGAGCSATSGSGTTVSGGTYETDDDGYKWCCKGETCVECGGNNTCTNAKKRGVLVAPPPGGGVLAP